MQRTIKIRLTPTQKKKDEILSTMEVYKETVNRFINKFSKYKYLNKLDYKYLYNPKDKDLRINSNYSVDALKYALTLLNKRFNIVREKCKIRIYNHIIDKDERYYLFYLLKQPKCVESIILRKKFVVKKEFNVRSDYLNKYLHRILREEFKNNKLPKLKKKLLRTGINTSIIRNYKNSKQFNYVLKLSTINKRKRVIIPFNPNKWAQNFFERRKCCFIVCVDVKGNINLHIPIEEKPKENNNAQEIGVDIGFRNLLVDSNKKMYGKNWSDVEKKLDVTFQKKQKQRNKLGSLRRELYKKWILTKDVKIYKKIKNLEKFNLGKIKLNNVKFKRKETIKNNINGVVNKFIVANPNLKTIVLEKLNFKSKTYGKKSNRLLNQWKIGFLKSKLTFISQLNSIELAYQNPAYTSQHCPNCGFVSRDNRHKEEFTCVKCGLSEHADVIGAFNTLQRKYDSEIGLYTPYKKVKEILLKRYSVGVIKPPGLENLNREGCESYKQSIQEQNIKLATEDEKIRNQYKLKNDK